MTRRELINRLRREAEPSPAELAALSEILVDTPQTAQLLGCSASAIHKRRASGRDILTPVRIGRLVRYRLSDIAKFLQAR